MTLVCFVLHTEWSNVSNSHHGTRIFGNNLFGTTNVDCLWPTFTLFYSILIGNKNTLFKMLNSEIVYPCRRKRIKEFKSATEFKYVGVIFDDHLSWKEHIKTIVSKTRRRVGLLGGVRRHITSHSANASYISMIRPILEYCAGIWASS